jgi:CRISPR/Cas system CSM-associated protein Csm3 (group 7 of RAMP superfamily)
MLWHLDVEMQRKVFFVSIMIPPLDTVINTCLQTLQKGSRILALMMRPSTHLIVIDLLLKEVAQGNFYQEVTLCFCILKNNNTLDRVTIASTLYSTEMQFSNAGFKKTGVKLCICVSKLSTIAILTSMYLRF